MTYVSTSQLTHSLVRVEAVHDSEETARHATHAGAVVYRVHFGHRGSKPVRGDKLELWQPDGLTTLAVAPRA